MRKISIISKPFSCVAALILTTTFSVGQTVQQVEPRWVLSGSYSQSVNKTFQFPSRHPRKLELSDTKLSDALNKSADSIALSSDRLSLTLIEEGKIIYQKQKFGMPNQIKMVGYSMSKSVTSIMVGYALCEGFIDSLNDYAGVYSNSLSGSIYASASIRNLLNMTSGARASDEKNNGEPLWIPRFTDKIRRSEVSILDALQDHRNDKSSLKDIGAGNFQYSNLDTAALSFVLEGAAGQKFHEWYEKTIIKDAGFDSISSWTLDRNGMAGSHALLHASPDDWVRIALLSLDLYDGLHGNCLRDYMHAAIRDTVPIIHSPFQKNPFREYGYQFWTGMEGTNSEAFWMLGALGQYIGIDPISRKILVASSIQHSDEIFTFFLSWISDGSNAQIQQ